MKTQASTPARKGFTLIELLTVIAIIGILAAILIPVVGTVRFNALKAQDISQIRQWGLAVRTYMNDLRGPIDPPQLYRHGDSHNHLDRYTGGKGSALNLLHSKTWAAMYNKNPQVRSYAFNNNSYGTWTAAENPSQAGNAKPIPLHIAASLTRQPLLFTALANNTTNPTTEAARQGGKDWLAYPFSRGAAPRLAWQDTDPAKVGIAPVLFWDCSARAVNFRPGEDGTRLTWSYQRP